MTTPLWTYDEILRAVGGASTGSSSVFGVAIDSREAAPGDLFIALKGAVTDGHEFVMAAFKMGASAALVSKKPKAVNKNDPRLIWVDDTYTALLELAAAARKRTRAQIIAITGTAGKTGTKDVLFEALRMKAKTHTNVRSFNNHIGVPLSLARMPRGAAYGVFEVGMNAPGDIAPLSHLISPDVALITTVGKGHLAAFKNEVEIAKEKAAIFDGMPACGIAILNFDNRHFGLLKKKAKKAGIKKILTFSETTDSADACILKSAHLQNCSCLAAKVNEEMLTYKVAMPGHHWVMNSLGVLLAVDALRGDLGLAGLALASYEPQAGRGKVYEINTERGVFQVVDESYNSNPASLRAALEVFEKMRPARQTGRKIAVLGDMEELGKTAKAEHLGLAADLEAAGVNLVYAKGPGMTALLKAVKPGIGGFAFENNRGISKKLAQDIMKGDLILVKGSRAARLDEVVDDLNEMSVSENDSGWGLPAAAAE